MRYKYILLLLCILILGSCSTKKKQAELLELSKPEWVKARPINTSFYHGIGITPKTGAPLLYQDKARQRALSDISSQINTHIQSETNFYQVEDNSGVREYIQNRINATSAEFLEGYEYVDKWEDLQNVYVYYQLSKQTFKELKAKRKADAISNAKLKYIEARENERLNNSITAMTLYANTIDILSGYMNEENSTLINHTKVDLVTDSKNRLVNLIRNLRISADQAQFTAKENQNVEEGQCTILVSSNTKTSVSDIPVKFKYSGGYLINELAKSDQNGLIPSPAFKKSSAQTDETITAEIDLTSLSRHITRNLYVRKLVEKEKRAKASILIIN